MRLFGLSLMAGGLALALVLAGGRALAGEDGDGNGGGGNGNGRNGVVDRNQDPHGPHAGQAHKNGTVDQGWHGGKQHKHQHKAKHQHGQGQGGGKDRRGQN